MVERKQRALGLWMGGAAVIALLAAGPALAQQAQAPGTEPASLDEIVVTAQRRAEKLQDVPVTVTAFSAEEIEEARIRQIDDVASRTPGLSFDAFPASQPRISVRGIGSSDRGAAGDPSSAVFLDEIYLGRPAAVAFDAFDVARIEVLKGPQGTLFGRNVVGGAINVVTNRPKLDVVDAALEATVGNYDRLEGAGFVNAPVVDGKLAVRASAAWRTHDGYVKNTYTGDRVEDQDTRSGRFQVYAEPSENLRLSLSVDGTRDRGNGPAQHVLDLDTTDPLSAYWKVDRDRNHTAGSTDGYQNRDTWGLRYQADWDLPFATLTYLGSYRDLDYHAAYDFDGGNPTTNALGISGGNDEASTFSSNELRLSALPESRMQWVAGFFNYNADTDRLDILNLDMGPRRRTEIYTQAASLASYAGYGDVTVPVTDEISLIGGVRYSRDEKDYHVSNTAGGAIIRGTQRFDVKVSGAYAATTYRGGVQYHLTGDDLLYAMVSRGFKSGGFQDTPATAAEAVAGFKPEFATQYEVGQKSTFLGGSLIWNNTFYLMKYTDLQTRRTLPDLSIVTDNAGEATIKGYETYLSWRVFTGAHLVASYGYTDARFDKYEPEPGVDYSGNRITRTPRHKVVVSPSYDVPLAGGVLRFAVDYRYESRIFDDASNDGPEQRDPTNFLDGRIVFTDETGKWSVSLWGKNLTDEVTRTYQGTFLGADFGAYNPPRTYGLTVNWQL
ncbi:TonB-dependent receptor [Azospirillum sp. B4]|uniref:TonB-dependent receptor n=1 Tax=Azospirillum sp. B4 TaxID=95605 RepID=UPI001901AF92|nr:TonB-dependent receptor [Azospirillum sp. B4]